MSEYQYYEFRAIDIPLTHKQMGELRSFSTRADITESSFVNEYHWGSFKGDSARWMETYFDASLYLANWGSRRLMFSLPTELLAAAAAYESGESISLWTKGKRAVLDFYFNDDSGEWYDEDGHRWLSELLPLRTELLAGDLRGLYLGWLKALEFGEVDETDEEPPVPPGLANLSVPQRVLSEFFEIDGDLISAAAEGSPDRPERKLTAAQIARWAAALDNSEKEAIVVALVEGSDRQLGTRLRERARDAIHGELTPGKSKQRTAGELLARAEELADHRRRREARALREAKKKKDEAERREKYLKSLEGKEDKLWERVEALVTTTQPKPYDAAVALLLDLRDLAARSRKQDEFRGRFEALQEKHRRKVTFVQRLQKVGLLS